mgnify:CR=1 FL=1
MTILLLIVIFPVFITDKKEVLKLFSDFFFKSDILIVLLFVLLKELKCYLHFVNKPEIH